MHTYISRCMKLLKLLHINTLDSWQPTMPGADGSIGPQKMSQRCAPSIPAADWWWKDDKRLNMVETLNKTIYTEELVVLSPNLGYDVGMIPNFQHHQKLQGKQKIHVFFSKKSPIQPSLVENSAAIGAEQPRTGMNPKIQWIITFFWPKLSVSNHDW